MAHRDGTYVQRSTRRSGDCGDLPEQVVRIDDPHGLPANCALDAADEVSADQCKLSRSYTCTFDDGGSGSLTAITSEHDGGETVSGVLSMRLYDAAGGVRCVGSYDTTFTRQ